MMCEGVQGHTVGRYERPCASVGARGHAVSVDTQGRVVSVGAQGHTVELVKFHF